MLGPEGPDYALKEWPQGYQMFDHNKGPADGPRHDAYLMGKLESHRPTSNSH